MECWRAGAPAIWKGRCARRLYDLHRNGHGSLELGRSCGTKASAAGALWKLRRVFHATGIPSFLLSLRGADWLSGVLRQQRLERAIGVIYMPESERVSHYFTARLAEQFDAVIHIDQTRAVEPLERTSQWETGELPETYPFAV